MSRYDKSMEYASQTQTLIGTQRKRLIDEQTGEVIEVDQITKRALGQKAFWKIYLMDFLQVLGGFEYKQLDVLIYILENTEQANNTFIGTYRSLERDVGVSYDTVRRTITLLQSKGFIVKIANGVYQISPNIMMKGSEHKKTLLLNYYADKVQEVLSDPEEQDRNKGQRNETNKGGPVVSETTEAPEASRRSKQGVTRAKRK